MQIPSFRRLAVPATACALLAALPAAAEPLPLWEAGLGVAAVTLPDYRGADSSQTYVLPAPYFVYRGEFLKADRNGVRSTLFNTERVELNISLNATLPVSSKNNTVRQGMASLRPTVELGPTLSVNLWKADSGGMKLDLRTPLRTAVTIESSPRQIGWLFAPNLNLDVRDPFGMSGWNLGMLAGPNFQSRRYNRYFRSATPTRPPPVRATTRREAMPARSSRRPCPSASSATGSGHSCATTRWAAHPSRTARWCRGRTRCRPGLRSPGCSGSLRPWSTPAASASDRRPRN